jgi:diacylglycerol kinase (ATP)
MQNEIKRLTLVQKFLVALKGAIIPFKSEMSIRIQLSLAVCTIALGFYLHISRTDWALIIIATGFVLITETLNTAIEKLVDLVSPGYNQLAGLVKDIAAGAVFMAATVSLIIGLIVFLPYF